jgi:3'(2'), 5'-bisphosphate nucleotidase
MPILDAPDVRFAVELVRQAALLTRQIQRSMAVEGLVKSDLSPVTMADYAVQAVAGRALAERFPGEPLVGEESSENLRTPEGAAMLDAVTRFAGSLTGGASPDEACAWIDLGTSDPAACFWTLDPLDGTKGYLRGGQYAVALARIEHGQVTLGVLGCPSLASETGSHSGNLGTVAVAVRGQGAWCTALDAPDEPRPMQVSDCADPARARLMRSFESGHTNTGQIDAIARALGVQAEPVRMDSQAKYAVLAGGGAELLFRLLSPKALEYKEKIWDQAAGSIILEEAGGRVTDLEGRPLDFTAGRTLANNTGLLASNNRLHEPALRAIAEVCGIS